MLIRQPNDKLCLCDEHGRIIEMNLTENDYIEYCATKAKEFVKNEDNIKHFGELIKMKTVSDIQLKKMGSDKPFKELIKYIPENPVDTHYIEINFETIGKCPNCGADVVNGIGGKDAKCKKCEQMLKW